MSQPVPSPSPYPPGTTERIIWVGADGLVLPETKRNQAVRGEIVLTFPDGRFESTTFTTEPRPTV